MVACRPVAMWKVSSSAARYTWNLVVEGTNSTWLAERINTTLPTTIHTHQHDFLFLFVEAEEVSQCAVLFRITFARIDRICIGSSMSECFLDNKCLVPPLMIVGEQTFAVSWETSGWMRPHDDGH